MKEGNISRFNRSIDFPVFEFSSDKFFNELESLRKGDASENLRILVNEKKHLEREHQMAQIVRQQNEGVLKKAKQTELEIRRLKLLKQKLTKDIQEIRAELIREKEHYDCRIDCLEEEYRMLTERKVHSFEDKTWTQANDLSKQIEANHMGLECEVKRLVGELEVEDRTYLSLCQELEQLQIRKLKQGIDEKHRH